MNIRKLFSGGLFLLTAMVSQAQPDSARISQKALWYADSLVKTDGFQDWSSYADLAPSSVVKYYGGKDGYIGHVQQIRMYTISTLEEAPAELEMQTLVTLKDQWQCVIRLSRYFHREDRKYHLVSYLVGQSKDEGESWKIFDVNYNLVVNLIQIFPEILDMPLKQHLILSEEQELAQQQKAQTASTAAKRGVTKRK